MPSIDNVRRKDLLEQAQQYMCDVGIAQFNADHLELFYHILLLQEYVEKVEMQQDVADYWQQVDATISFLQGYTLQHLKKEEELMLASNYFGYGLHKAHHDKLIEEFVALKDLIEQFRKTADVAKLKNFLLTWLFQHTSSVDIEYKDKLDISKLEA